MKEKIRNKKNAKWIMILVFLLLVFGMTLGGLFLKDRDFSENENRYLTSAPEFSWEDFLSGDYQDSLEEYLNDQIAFRDQWITLKTGVEKTTGNKDIGGAYLGKDGYDFEKILPEDVDPDQVEKNAQAVEDFFADCQNTIDKDRLSFLLIPTSGLVENQKLPQYAILFDQDSYMDQITATVESATVIDCRQALEDHAEEYIYYKTDHHWTSQGAFYGFCAWGEATGHSIDTASYTKTQVSDQFRGSLYSKILDSDSAYDSIDRWTNTADTASYTVLADGNDLGGIYQEDKLEEKDKYAYFFGGNYGEVEISRNDSTKDAGQEERNLLVVKDSFANSFVPLLVDQYDHVDMIDLRYYSGNIQEYMEEKNITDVLVLYNVSNFVSDKNIYLLSRNL